MPRKNESFTGWMILGFFKDIFLAIFRAFGQLLGSALVAGLIGAIGGGGVAIVYGFPVMPWVIGGFVVCAILALVLIFFVATDL